MQFHTAGDAKSAVYDCLVPFDDKSMETSLSLAMLPVIIRPHHSTTFVDAAYCYRLSSMVCLSVCHLVSPAKTSEAIEMPFALRTRVGPRNHLLDIAERFQSNTVLWAFHTIQPSS